MSRAYPQRIGLSLDNEKPKFLTIYFARISWATRLVKLLMTHSIHLAVH
jgi:hypothetical protein